MAFLGYTNGNLNLTNSGMMEIPSGDCGWRGTVVVLDASGTVRLTTDGSTKPLVRPGELTIAGTLEVVLAEDMIRPTEPRSV